MDGINNVSFALFRILALQPVNCEHDLFPVRVC